MLHRLSSFCQYNKQQQELKKYILFQQKQYLAQQHKKQQLSDHYRQDLQIQTKLSPSPTKKHQVQSEISHQPKIYRNLTELQIKFTSCKIIRCKNNLIQTNRKSFASSKLRKNKNQFNQQKTKHNFYSSNSNLNQNKKYLDVVTLVDNKQNNQSKSSYIIEFSTKTVTKTLSDLINSTKSFKIDHTLPVLQFFSVFSSTLLYL